MDQKYSYKPELLIVDPLEATCDVMREMLSDHLSISYAPSAKKAIELLESKDFAFMISEMTLDDMDGFDFVKKAREIRPYIQFVALTTESSPEHEIRALKAGAIEYIRKPFTIEEIALLLEKFRSISVYKKEEYDFFYAITEEKRTFCLPTNLEILNVFIHELLEIIKRFGLKDKNEMFAIRLSIYEMLINAYEHGNLEVDYERKKDLLEKDINYLEFLRKRSAEEHFRDRKIWVTYHYHDKKIVLTIRDEGRGFDYKKYREGQTARNVEAVHGRGIFITRVNMDEMIYNQSGNEVTLIKQIETNALSSDTK